MSKLTRYWVRKHPNTDFLFIRNHFRKLCPETEMIINTNEGFKMLASPHDYASYQIFFLGCYDRWLTSFMKAHITEGSVCWDIGTERGWFTMLMASLVGPNGRVDAFEAFPPNFRKLQNNLSLNNFHWVKANNLAISEKRGAMHFVPPSNEVTHNIKYLQDCSGVGYLSDKPVCNSISVSTISIDEYADIHPLERLDLIKIDIEGAEYAALFGGEKVINKFRPKIIIEYNRESAKRAGSSIEKLDNLINSYGYDRYMFFTQLKKLNLENWANLSESETVFNVYCFPKYKGSEIQ